MLKFNQNSANSFFVWWSNTILRAPKVFLLFVTILCGLSLFYTVNNLAFNMDTTGFLSDDLPFQKNRHLFAKNFPNDNDTFLIIVEAETPEHSRIVAAELKNTLEKQPDLFSFVYSNDNAFFKRQSLLYLNSYKVSDLAEKLIKAQPFIGYMSHNLHLPGLLELLGEALTHQKDNTGLEIIPVLQSIDKVIGMLPNIKLNYLSWQETLSLGKHSDDKKFTQLITAKPVFNFNNLLPTESSMALLHTEIESLTKKYPSIKIRITGGPALEHDELASLSNDMIIAGLVSLFLVCCSLLAGLHSLRLMMITFAALIYGLIFTAAFATLSVGHLNMLSVAFAVLYIGLGVDFSLHICLRYKECVKKGYRTTRAITSTLQDMWFSLLLCALTTSIGFFAFVPTSYIGVSELGIISGGGMFIGFFMSIMVLPAFLKLSPLRKVKKSRFDYFPISFYTFPFRYKTAIRIISILITIGAAYIFTGLKFDSNPVNLRNQKSESVVAFKELLKAKQNSPFALFALTDSLQEAKQKAAELKRLRTVDKAITIADLVPERQDEKLAIIDELNLIYGKGLQNFDKPIAHLNSRQALQNFLKILKEVKYDPDNTIPLNLLSQFQRHIQAFIYYADSNLNTLPYQKLDEQLLSLLPITMQQLQQSLNATQFTMANIPYDIKQQWVSNDNIYKIIILPSYDLNDPKRLTEFVNDVKSIDPTVTGYPIVDQASADAVIEAFAQAFISAVVAIFIILLIILRSLRQTLLVIGPLLMATLLTGAMNVLLNNAFNFANCIAIPLLLGMGVDSGIHIMHRLNHALGANELVLKTSTSRGVFFSSLTTMFSFTSLAFLPHAGIASMGLLLAIGITFTLLCTLVVLPAFSHIKVKN